MNISTPIYVMLDGNGRHQGKSSPSTAVVHVSMHHKLCHDIVAAAAHVSATLKWWSRRDPDAEQMSDDGGGEVRACVTVQVVGVWFPTSAPAWLNGCSLLLLGCLHFIRSLAQLMQRTPVAWLRRNAGNHRECMLRGCSTLFANEVTSI
jgi:hypothetical protein